VSSETDNNPLGPPPWLNAPPVERYPYADTHDLRSGPDLHPALLGLLPFVGLWRGRGQGGFPAEEDYDFAQEVRISHDGRPFLKFESRSWLLDADSKAIGQWATELGFWRPVLVDGRPGDEMEATMMTPDGAMELYLGRVSGTRLEVVELVGEPGDAWLIDLRALHAAAPNCSDRPRLMATHRFVRSDRMTEIAQAFGWT